MNGREIQLLQADPRALYFTTDAGVLRLATGDTEATMLFPATRVTHLTSDLDALYASLYDDGSIHRIPKAGGPTTLLFAKSGLVGGIAVHGDDLFFTWSPAPISPSRTPQGRGNVSRIPKRGGRPELLAGGLTGPRAVVADALGVAFFAVDERITMEFDLAEGRNSPTRSQTYSVAFRTASGSRPTELARGRGSLVGIGSDPERIFWWSEAELTLRERRDASLVRHRIHVVGVDADAFYALEGRALRRYTKSWGEPVTLAEDQTSIPALATGGSAVYWIDESPEQGRQVLASP